MEHTSGAGLDGWQGVGEFTSPDGLIVLSVDYGDEDFHIDARPGHSPAAMRLVLAQARARGLEPMDADECEPEILEDDTIRIYLALAEQPPATVAPMPVKSIPARPGRKRALSIFALTAAVIVGILVPTPLRHFYPDMPSFGEDAAESIPQRYHDPVTQTVRLQTTKGN